MNTIEFIPWNEEVLHNIESPVPAKTCIPEWYKKSFKYEDSNKISFYQNENDNLNPKSTIKGCIPVLDSMSMGYIQKTWCDIYIERNEKEIIYKYAGSPKIISVRENSVKQFLPAPIGCDDILFDWKRYWIPKTPNGYSCMYTHPAYHYDLPFFTISGIIDSDVYNLVGLNSPSFFIKNNFSGLIPKGTPMYQIIPFKRENWKKREEPLRYNSKVISQAQELSSLFVDKYKRIFWQRKSFE